MSNPPLYTQSPSGEVHLHSPTSMPDACGFLWNKYMMIQMNCRGYATAQFMQPEPAKYSRGPTLEATTFMQPEHPYYAHHPGRFFYIRDNDTGDLFSAPHEPVRAKPDTYRFTCTASSITWLIERGGVRVELSLSLTKDDICELWRVKVTNISDAQKALSLFPCFSLGYMSWMNQSATYDDDLQAIVGNSVTPYQKVEDYFKNRGRADKTYLVSSRKPTAWLANQRAYEGEGGLHAPDALKAPKLPCLSADYEMPIAVMQFDSTYKAGETEEFLFAFGPTRAERYAAAIRDRYLRTPDAFENAEKRYGDYIAAGKSAIKIETGDASFDHFVNHWLPRQVFYHGDVNRLTTDPQTRNFLQDHMGMAYIDPDVSRESFLLALSQQHYSGDMPDGVLLRKDAELKYINQVPHADHNVWLTICLKAYLDETGDYAVLQEEVPYKDNTQSHTLVKHINRAMDWLLANRDERGLSFIHQGDWCDPMNMVGYQGKGVSAWLTMATSYALKVWCSILDQIGEEETSRYFQDAQSALNDCINKYFWDGNWYARGITDDGNSFGTAADPEGKIFLNAQSWALLCGAADGHKQSLMLAAIAKQLETPYGPMMLAPAFTGMRADIGRVTQKHPGSAENGSVYNHAAIFFIYSLFQIGKTDKAFELLRKMLPSEEDAGQRGQLPTYIPNYYRGAFHQLPRTAGKSSHLFNTGTVAWYYRSVIEELFGLTGSPGGLKIEPKLPSSMQEASVTREFRGATFKVSMHRSADKAAEQLIKVNGAPITGAEIQHIQRGHLYEIEVILPATPRKEDKE